MSDVSRQAASTTYRGRRERSRAKLDEIGAEKQAARFEKAQFVAFLGKEFTTDAYGSLQITVTVPSEFFDEALPLRTALMQGIPLHFDVTTYAPAPPSLPDA